MTVNWETIRRHTLVLLATVSGIVGMGIVFRAVMDGSVVGVSRGAPFLLIGLWWVGRELGRSIIASRNRRLSKSLPNQPKTSASEIAE